MSLIIFEAFHLTLLLFNIISLSLPQSKDIKMLFIFLCYIYISTTGPLIVRSCKWQNLILCYIIILWICHLDILSRCLDHFIQFLVLIIFIIQEFPLDLFCLFWVLWILYCCIHIERLFWQKIHQWKPNRLDGYISFLLISQYTLILSLF